MTRQAFRGSFLHYIADPQQVGASARVYYDDALLLVNAGKVESLLPFDQHNALSLADVTITDYSGHLLIPGMIDLHTHYPQLDMIASYGLQLLDWLNDYTFPTEAAFVDKKHASQIAQRFLRELLRHGTTTAMVFSTVHTQSVEAFFEQALALNLRMITGKVMMDRNAPRYLCDSAEQSFLESQQLIERWHGQGRLAYAITPRFAPSSSVQQLALAGELYRLYPDVYVQSHLAENQAEVDWVRTLFPHAKDYVDVYQQAGLLGPRSIYAHGIHLDVDACQRLAESQSVLAHCPTSNLFLGSGLFPMARIQQQGVRFALGTDIGAGTSLSLFRTLAEAYKIQQLQQHQLDPDYAFYLATLGGAQALGLQNTIGNFLPGKEADFVVLDVQAGSITQQRLKQCRTLTERLFVLAMLGDDRQIYATYILGECVYLKDNVQEEVSP